MSTRFFLRQLGYDLNANLLFRPAMWLFGLGGASFLLPQLEGFAPAALRTLLSVEPGTAQVVLSTLASSVMTVVSVVYSLLLVALSLASMQFSTRILVGFVRDRLSQHVLGLFVGTFAYCLGVLRWIHLDPPDVPVLSVNLAMALALGCLASLVLFIHHLVMGIQANVIVDRIASEAETVIAQVFPMTAIPQPVWAPEGTPRAIVSDRSGYVQLVDVAGLLTLSAGHWVELLRPMGSFVPKGAPLFRVWGRADEAWERQLMNQIDIGPMRTMQDDVEFGFRQIVDIALKAVSPAVNDPSTAATCIDHLGRLLMQTASRAAPPTVFGKGELRIPATSFCETLDLTVEQLRQYGRSDMAVCLRLMRILSELAPLAPGPAGKRRVQEHANQLFEAASRNFSPEDMEELRHRHATCLKEIGAVPES